MYPSVLLNPGHTVPFSNFTFNKQKAITTAQVFVEYCRWLDNAGGADG